MLTFNELLETYYVFRYQRTVEITGQLHRLHQQIESQLLTIRAQESEFVVGQEHILNQLRPHLANDARVLFSTSEFQVFLESLLQKGEANELTIDHLRQMARNPFEWLLSSLPFALQLHDIEVVQPASSDKLQALAPGIKLQIQLADWQHSIVVPIHSTRPWFEVLHQIGNSVLQQPLNGAIVKAVDIHLQPILVQELTCLLIYVGTLFHINIQAEQFNCFTFIKGVKPR